jgi:TatA/E family protein of Tat protein translocase
VVVGIAVHVQDRGARSVGDAAHTGEVAALAEVDHALQHRRSLASGAGRCRSDERGWYGDPVNLGAPELLIVLLVILVLFGGAKLPKLARSLGQAQNEFKQGMKESTTSDEDEPKA